MTARRTVLEDTGELVHCLRSLCCGKKMPKGVCREMHVAYKIGARIEVVNDQSKIVGFLYIKLHQVSPPLFVVPCPIPPLPLYHPPSHSLPSLPPSLSPSLSPSLPLSLSSSPLSPLPLSLCLFTYPELYHSPLYILHSDGAVVDERFLGCV